MAQNKKSFILYSDLLHTIELMPDENAGKLFKHILKYVNDLDPETDDLITKLSFEPIKQQLKRDLVKWEDTSLTRSEIGRLGGIKSGEARRTKSKQNEPNALNPKQNEHDNVNVSVNDSVNDNDINQIIINDNLNTNAIVVKNPNFVKFEIWITENCPQVAKMKEPFTEAQFLKISKDFSRELIKETIEAMHNKKDLLKKYNSANLTLRSWINLKNQKNGQSTKSEPTDAYDKLSETIRKFGNVD